MNGNVSKEKAGSGNLFVRDGKVYVRDGYAQIELKKAYQTYGVSIDLSNSNPETAVTYINDAVGMSPGSDDWYKMNIFRNIKPCLLQNGTVVGYLNPNNFAQFEDGTAADITSGNGGDVMIEIPKTGYRINKRGTMLTVQITDEPNKEGFSYKAHTRSTEGDRDNLYIGAFLGSVQSSKLRSLSGKRPISNVLITQSRAYAQANGNRYDQMAFYPLTLLQCMYLIQYKNLNSQQALGMGLVGGAGASINGETVTKGMNYGTENDLEAVKFLGIEDFWGGLAQWVDGIVFTETKHALIATESFSSPPGASYTDVGQIGESYMFGFMKSPHGTNATGFIAIEDTGSSSTYFSDFVETGTDNGMWPRSEPVFGSGYSDGVGAGAFSLRARYMPNGTLEWIGCRLMYL